MLVYRLHQTIAAVCPISSVSVGNLTDRATWAFSPLATATPQQIAAAQTTLDAFDASDAASTAWENDQHPERKALRAAAAQAVTDIDTYLAITTPTVGQVTAQVRRLSQDVRAIIQRLIQID